MAITDVLYRKQDVLSWSPAKKLQYAVLTDALSCLNVREGVNYNDTVAWIVSQESDYVFSFEFCCRSFGLDPGATRKILLYDAKRYVAKELG